MGEENERRRNQLLSLEIYCIPDDINFTNLAHITFFRAYKVHGLDEHGYFPYTIHMHQTEHTKKNIATTCTKT